MSTPQDVKWPQGYRINPRAAGPARDLVDAFRAVPVAVAGDCVGRSVGTVGLKPYHGNTPATLCGPAITVRVRPGDNLMIHKAMFMAEPGDVIVVDGAGDLTQALVGGLMRTSAVAKGLGGFVLDGACRDTAEWGEGGMPIFAKGHTHRGPSKDGPGEINVPIACAGLAVNPGDLVLGDADGVIAIPAADLAALLPQVQAHLAKEAKIRETNAKNAADPERFNAILRAKGLPV
jgi:regulator of RNase E activity RraA